MKQAGRKSVAILGAGMAGLTAANYLKRNGVPVVVFEAGKNLAGLAQSFHSNDGYTYDFGAHFITNRLAAAIGIDSECRLVKYYGETVWINGKTYSYPFGLMRNPRYLSSAMISRAAKLFDEKPQSAGDWFRHAYGRALAEEVAIPLTEAWSGARADELSSAVGEKIPSSIAKTAYLKLLGRLRCRAISIGFSQELPDSSSVWHVYPNGGLGYLCQKLAEPLSDDIELESPIEEIIVESGKAVAIRAKGVEWDVAAVVSTAPCHVLAKLIRGTDALRHLTEFRYRPMIFVNLRFQGRGFLPDVVTWTPESRFPFFRLTETPLSMPWLAPEGKTLITADIGCERGDAIWEMTDQKLGEFCLDHLTPFISDARRRYQGCQVLRTPIAYPVFLKKYEDARQRFATTTDIEGLYSIGRNGEFGHLLMEDIYWRTLKKMAELRSYLDTSDCRAALVA